MPVTTAVSIAGVITGIKNALDICKGIFQAATISDEMRNQLLALQTALVSANLTALDAQSSQATALARVDALEQEIVRMKDWSAEKVQYQLAPIGGGAVLAYAVKEAEARGEAAHLLCSNCFEQGRKTLLQQRTVGTKMDQRVHIVCSKCQSDVATRFAGIGAPKYAEHYLAPPADVADPNA